MNQESTTGQGDRPLKIAIAAGGTGGHISPAEAVLEELTSRGTPFTAVWIGSRGTFEREAAQRWKIPYHAIQVGKLRRYVSLHTVTDSFRVPLGIIQARSLLARERPDVVFSTGGYVGVPAVIAARWLRIPSLTHEQTAILGLATRINARFTDTIALSYAGTPHPRRRPDANVIVTGNPVRPTLLGGCADRVTEFIQCDDDLPILYVTGGAQGATAINQAVEEALPSLLSVACVIHQCGPNEINGDFSRLKHHRDELEPELRRRYWPVERVSDELRDIYAAATLVIGRSGAGTVAELAALGIPSILIPLPGAYEALENARVMERSGGAILLPQDDLSPATLMELVSKLILEPKRLEAMREGAKRLASGNAAATLVEELLTLATTRQRS